MLIHLLYIFLKYLNIINLLKNITIDKTIILSSFFLLRNMFENFTNPVIANIVSINNTVHAAIYYLLQAKIVTF